MINFDKHPCFNDSARHTYSRVHLPVAPKCNIQCKFCDRAYDCMNESRPGVTSAVLSPGQAIAYLDKICEKVPNLSVVGIAGPGDPFANADETMETLRLVRQKYPEVLLCVASNGLNAQPYAEELARLQLSHISITVNAVDPVVSAKIYSWVRDGKKVLRGEEGAMRLWERQRDAIREFKNLGMVVKVNTIIIPGINDDHIPFVARRMKELGVDIINPLPFYPVKGSEFADLPEPDKEMVLRAREAVSKYVPVMTHCMRCRADAAGILGKDSDELKQIMRRCAQMPLNPADDRPYVAAASREGMLVNQHLGETEDFYIFKQDNGGFELVERRKAPLPGGGDERWKIIAGILKDCQAVLVAKVGSRPKEYLENCGIKVLETSGLIDYSLAAVFSGKDIPAELRTDMQPCAKAGAECGGGGTGCS